MSSLKNGGSLKDAASGEGFGSPAQRDTVNRPDRTNNSVLPQTFDDLKAVPKLLPKHIAIIMDGNGRWAAKRGLGRIEGHRRGAETVRAIIETTMELKIQHLTLFSFSSENWSRPATEVGALMDLLKRFIRKHLAELHKNGVKLTLIGRRDGVKDDIIPLIEEAEKLTCKNTKLHLNMAFNYGARDEILRAVQTLADKVADGTVRPGDITEAHMDQALDTHGSPDPDLLIRTSGEVRLSNFLLWQCAYTELVFPDVYWPDYNKSEYVASIVEYLHRDRRFGGRPDKKPAERSRA